MPRFPEKPEEIFDDIVNDYKDLFGEGLLSIILYGSAAGDDYIAGKSDINFMVVLSEEAIDSIDRAFAVVAKWKKRNVATPLFLTEAYVATSLDVFPIEYLNFRNRHRLVYGKDILKDISPDRRLMRLQCEREIKAKLLLLREGFLESRGKGRHLRQLIDQSLGAFVAIFNALLYVKGEDPPSHRRAVARRMCGAFDMDGGLFERLLDLKEKKVKLSDSEIIELFKQYLKEVQGLWKRVDRLMSDRGTDRH